MNKTIILLLALCAFASAAKLAEYDVTESSFAFGPVAIIQGKEDKAFTKNPLLTRCVNGSFIVLWGFNDDEKTPATWTATRRYINATSLTATSTETLDLGIVLLDKPTFAYSHHGYVAVVGTDSSVAGSQVRDLYIYDFISTAQNKSDVNRVKITQNNDSKTDFRVQQFWFQDDYFYVVYSAYSIDSEADKTLYLQGYAAINANYSKFETPLNISKTALTGRAQARCGQVPQSERVICAWRQETQGRVVAVQIDLIQGTVEEEIVIATDAGNKKFFPEAVIGGTSYTVILMNQVANGLVSSFSVKLSTSQAALSLPVTLGVDFERISATAASAYYDGWFLIARSSKQALGINADTEENLLRYTSSGELNGTTINLVDNGRIIQGFTLPNQSYFVLIADNMNGNINTGYLGKVFDKISFAYGTVLKTCFMGLVAFVAFFVAF